MSVRRDPAPGERWAYRWRGPDPCDEVEVLQLGSKSPPRVLVRFVAIDQEGREEWVPPGRLKVPWAERHGFLEHERRWAAVRVAYLRGTPTAWAIDMVFDALQDWDLADEGYNADSGILRIRDVDALVSDLGLDVDTVTGDPRSFTDEGGLIVPWPVTEQIVRAMAVHYADTILPAIELLECEARSHNRWGYDAGGGHYISAEICAEFDEDFAKARALVREWCGNDGRERFDELLALRQEVRRLGQLVEEAVTALIDAGAAQVAARIERELGVPVEVIRAQQAERDR